MKLMIAILLVFMLVYGSVHGQSKARISVNFNYEQVSKFLEIFDQGEMTDVDFSELMELHASKAYARKLATFFDGVDHDSYQNSLQSALMGDPKKADQYMLNRVLPELPTIKAFLEEIGKSEDDISSKAARMISSFTPDSIDFNATVYLVVGITGGGWTFDDEDDAFYVDIRSMKGDLEGMIYLCAHELYHKVQDKFVPALESQSLPNRLIRDMIREGSASFVADFSESSGDGAYSDFNQKVYRTNSRRKELNFELFKTILFRSYHDTTATWDEIYPLGLTGQYDSPLYFVGYDIVSAIAKRDGTTALLSLMSEQPAVLLKRYIEITQEATSAEDNLIPLGASAVEIINRL